MRHCTLTITELESLALGYGSASALTRLRTGQFAVRRLQLMAIAQRSGQLPGQTRTRLDAAFAVLEQLARCDTEFAASLLRHPFLATWAAACLTRLESGTAGGVPIDIEFGYLSGLAAAGAARASMDFALEVPVWDGLVLLPTLGVIDVGRPGVATVQSTANGLTCSIGGHSVTVLAPFDAVRGEWWPVRRVRLAADRTLAIEDT